MATTRAEYFSDELTDWKRTMAFFSGETDSLTVKLGEVIGRNTIPNIAGKVEVQQEKLNAASGRFHRLHRLVEQQERAIKTGNALIDDSQIKPETENFQRQLRENMQLAEREYIEARHACYNFLADTFRNSGR
jgi:hypothetical protein